MAAAAYTTDLTPIIIDFPNTTGWTSIGGALSTLSAPETDYFIQGSNSISKSAGTGTRGMIYNSAQTITSGSAVFMWIFYQATNSLATESAGGMQILIGSAATAFKQYYVRGSDTYTYGGWVCIPVDPTVAADTQTGSPTTTTSYFGYQISLPSGGPSKGYPQALDAIRWGRTLQVVSGDLANGYATFASAAAKNDANDVTNGYNRWGLFQTIDGGYLQQGLFLMGTALTAVDFRDSNRNISIANTKKVQSTFNTFEVRNAGSRVDWTNINISALGTVSRGNFIATHNADINFNTCVFTDMGTFVFQSNSTTNISTFRRCGQVTGGGGSFVSCTFSNCRDAVSLVLTNLSQATDCTFESDGANHAVNLGTISSTTSMNWNNNLSGYAVNDGSTGNEAIMVNVAASQILTINVGTGYSTPSIYNTGSGTVTVVSGQVTTSVTVKALSDGSNISEARVLAWATDSANKFYNASVTITGSGTTATVTHTGHGLATGDYVIISGVTNDDDYNGVHQITKINDNSYSYTADDTLTSPATGTIVAKWAILSGTTNGSGYIEDIRSFNNPQEISGWVRKTSGSPYYQQGVISGTISTANGFSTIIQLIADE